MNLQRNQMLKNIIKQNNLAALIFWRPDELVLTLGYMPLWGLSFLIFTPDDEPVLFAPELEPADLLPSDISIKRFPWGILDCTDPWLILYSLIRETLIDKNVCHLPVSFIKNTGGSSPCMMSGEQPHLPADLVEELSVLSQGGYKEIASDLFKLYTHKTAHDIMHLRRTHKVASVAVETFYKNLNTGITEVELAGIIESSVQQLSGSEGIHYAKAWPLVQSGTNAVAGGRYNRSTGRKLQPGEMVMLEMGICVNGYWADITRTGQTSELSIQQKKIFNTVLEAQQKAISLMKPGVLMADVDMVARKHIEDAGYGEFFNHALGHHVGFRYHDFGPTLSPDSSGVLEEGMLLTVEPGIYGEEINCGVRIEDNVLITKTGNEILSQYSRLLIV